MIQSVFADNFKTDPYWWDAAPRPELPELPLPDSVDVAVIGSGFTGLSAAHTLAEGGRSVLVLEADRVGEGASTRNGGYAAKISLFGFSDLAAKFGVDFAVDMHKETKRAREYTIGIIEHERIPCHYKKPGRFVAARTRRQYDALARDLELMNKHVDPNADMIERDALRQEIDSPFYVGGQILHDAGDLHPGLFHQGLLDRAVAAGVSIAARTPMVGVVRDGNGFDVATNRGTVKARDVVLATNGYTGAATPFFRRRIIPVNSYIIATEDLGVDRVRSLLPSGRTVIDTSLLFFYTRPSPDGTRILFGGRTGLSDSDPRQTARRLYRYMTKVFPALDGVRLTHCWHGSIGMTFDFRPHIGTYEGMHYVLGMNGAGVLTGTYLGNIAGQRILGMPDTETMFDGKDFPTRPFYKGRPWFLPATMAYFALRDALGR